jgi:hypothetical protein
VTRERNAPLPVGLCVGGEVHWLALAALAPKFASEPVAFSPPRVPGIRVRLGRRFDGQAAASPDEERVREALQAADPVDPPRPARGPVRRRDDLAPLTGLFVIRATTRLHLPDRIEHSLIGSVAAFPKWPGPLLVLGGHWHVAAAVAVGLAVALEEPDTPTAIRADAQWSVAIGALEPVVLSGRTTTRGTAIGQVGHESECSQGEAVGMSWRGAGMGPCGKVAFRPGPTLRRGSADVSRVPLLFPSAGRKCPGSDRPFTVPLPRTQVEPRTAHRSYDIAVWIDRCDQHRRPKVMVALQTQQAPSPRRRCHRASDRKTGGGPDHVGPGHRRFDLAVADLVADMDSTRAGLHKQTA